MTHAPSSFSLQLLMASSIAAATAADAGITFLSTTWHIEASAADHSGESTIPGTTGLFYGWLAYEGSWWNGPVASAFAYQGARVDSLYGNAGIVIEGDLMGKNAVSPGAGIGQGLGSLTTTFTLTDTRPFGASGSVILSDAGWASAETTLMRGSETIFHFASGQAGSDPPNWNAGGELTPGTCTFSFRAFDGNGTPAWESGRTHYRIALDMPTPGAAALLVAAAGVARRRRR